MKEGLEDRFNFFIPVEFEKATTKKGEEVMKVRGIASTDDKDSEDEVLLPMGFELDRFVNHGQINWNHQGKNDPSKIIGEPNLARITPEGRLYIEGTLYKGHPLAESVWQYAKTLQANGSSRKLGWSIEGRATERDPQNPKRITKALITGVAITPTPVNVNTFVDLCKGSQKNDFVNYEYEKESLLEKAENESNYLFEFENSGKKYGITKSFNVEELTKGGEGSRGGKVIGHTRSGKPIYQSSDDNNTKDYGKEDHEDAANEHWNTAFNSMGKVKVGFSDSIYAHKTPFEHHNQQRKFHESKFTKAMDIAATTPLIPQSLDKEPKILEPVIRQAILNGLIPIEQIINKFK